MRTRRLGTSELEVSVVGLGGNNFGRRLDGAATRAVIDAAEGAGVTLIDTADIYGNGASESLLGEALAGRRERFVIATKFGMEMDEGGLPDAPRGSREYVHAAATASLRRLRVDVIDLYQYHRPDGVTPIEETLGALEELVRAGKVRHIGCSNFDADLLERSALVAEQEGITAFVSLQNEYSLLKREIERDVIPACERLGVGVLPYFPLASGLLTGKYRRGERAPDGTRLAGRGDSAATPEQFDVIEGLERFAAERGIGLLDVAIGGLAAQPAVASVIAGATRAEQIIGNARAGNWTPTQEDVEELNRLAPVV